MNKNLHTIHDKESEFIIDMRQVSAASHDDESITIALKGGGGFKIAVDNIDAIGEFFQAWEESLQKQDNLLGGFLFNIEAMTS